MLYWKNRLEATCGLWEGERDSYKEDQIWRAKLVVVLEEQGTRGLWEGERDRTRYGGPSWSSYWKNRVEGLVYRSNDFIEISDGCYGCGYSIDLVTPAHSQRGSLIYISECTRWETKFQA